MSSSPGAPDTPSATVSATREGEPDLCIAVLRDPATSSGRESRVSHTTPNDTTTAATPTPFKM
jgi:hypothetical protein